MRVSVRLEGKRGKQYTVYFSLDSLTNQVFIELEDTTHAVKKPMASKLEPRGEVGGRLIAGWFGSEK